MTMAQDIFMMYIWVNGVNRKSYMSVRWANTCKIDRMRWMGYPTRAIYPIRYKYSRLDTNKVDVAFSWIEVYAVLLVEPEALDKLKLNGKKWVAKSSNHKRKSIDWERGDKCREKWFFRRGVRCDEYRAMCVQQNEVIRRSDKAQYVAWKRVLRYVCCW